MPGIVRKNDICSGHGSAKPRPNVQGSPDVYANGRQVHRVGDSWAKHSGHTSVLASGSPNVYANNKPVGRQGDPIACGSVCAESSSDVIAN